MSLLDQLDSNIRPFAQQLFDIAKTAGVNPRVTSGVRTYAQQKRLYDDWIAGRAKYPAAPPGRSAHEYGLAFDMLVDGSVNQSDCGIVWTSWGGVYGGEEDPIHFEHPIFRSLPKRQDPGPVVQPVPVYTPNTITVKSRRLADKLAPYIYQELGYIVYIDALAHAIESVAGSDAPAALGTIEFGLEHPEEFLGAFHDAILSTYLSMVL